MFFSRKYLLFVGCLATAVSATAIPFDNTTANGVATVGVGGDYPTLAAAATAFNAVSSPYIQGNWKLEILNDLAEPTNISFGNTIPSGSSLTLKPAAATSSTVTFLSLVDNGGPSGHLVIGCSDLSGWNLVPTNNFTIDGSNNGSDSRNLTFANTFATTHTFTSPVVVAGASDFVTVKNSRIWNLSGTTGGGPAAFTAVTRIDGTDVLAPDDLTLHNCDLISSQTQGHGVNFRLSGTFPAGGFGMADWAITSNTIQSTLRGIFVDSGIDGDIIDNVIRVGSIGGTSNGFLQYGIGMNNARSATDQVLTVERNQIHMRNGNTFGGNFGPAAFNLVTGGTGNTVNFINNMISFQITSTSANAFTYVGFRATSALTYNILHNSINMPNFPNLTGLTPGGANAASAIQLPQTVAYTATVKNNILRVLQNGASAIHAANSGTPTLTSNNNIIYRDGATVYTGVTGTQAAPVTHLTLSDWQTATSQDANSAAVDPAATTGSKWELALTSSDLHFYPANVKPVEIPLQPILAEVSVDIDGETRAAGGTLPGADEVITSAVGEWSIY